MSTVKFDLNQIQKSITTSGKTGTSALPYGMADIAKQIICEPAIPTNMYVFELICTTDSSRTRFRREVDGTLNEVIDFPIYGNYTAKISEASSDDTFKIRILHI